MSMGGGAYAETLIPAPKNPSPIPINLQNIMNFSKDTSAEVIGFLQKNFEDTRNKFIEKQQNYINSMNTQVIKDQINQQISALKPVLDKLNSSIPSIITPDFNLGDGKKKFDDAISKLHDVKDKISQIQGWMDGDYDDMKKKLDTINYWGITGLNWGIKYNGHDYGWNDSDKLGPDIRNNAMYIHGKDNLLNLQKKISDLDQAIWKARHYSIYLKSDAIDEGKKSGISQGKNSAYTDAVKQVQGVLDGLNDNLKKLGEVKEDDLKDARDAVKKAYSDLQTALQSIIALNKLHQQAMTTIDKEQQSLSSLASSFSSNMTKVNFASSVATDSRLAKLSNPYLQDSEFAAYINAIKNQSLAANNVKSNEGSSGKSGSSASDFTSFLSPEVYGYDVLRFEKNNNLWGNLGTIIGNSNSINSVSGVFSFGYDAWVKNMILGAYGSYAYTTNAIANESSNNKSHNVDVGFYSRFFLGSNEIDVNVGESFGFNFLSFDDALMKTTLKGDYASFQTHLDLTYGYVFKIGKGWFSKPFIGINYNYGYNLGLDAKGSDASDISMGFDPFQTHFGAIKAGLELRKYFNDNQSYFYIAPAFYQGVLFQDTQAIKTRIYESSFVQNATTMNANQSLDTSFLLKAGGEWQASKDIFINISVGAKLGNLSQFGMLNIGGRWVF